MALTQKHKEKVCENNWIRRIVGEKIVNERRMDELRVEVGVKEIYEEIGEEKVEMGCDVERMGDDKLMNRCTERSDQMPRT